MKYSLIVLAALAFLVVTIPWVIGFRHYYGDTGTCPNATPQFFENAVREHFILNGKKADGIVFIPGSTYDAELSSIAFRKDGIEWLALVDCQGGLELSLKQ
nr:hypothetical protein [uncultured Cupriavidus sp.]